MKTLKKTLCLVLAMVMVFGLCAVSASAKLDAYTDGDAINYKEAVDVMSGIGILAGDDRGFRPGDNINRAEAAKIIAYIKIGDAKQADALKATTDPFPDVPASHWAAGYIQFCATAGIINGKANGYDPYANVTGLEFAKMLLCALGYGQQNEYVGTDWSIYTSKDALRFGIYDGNLAGASDAPATREECALYAFNTLQLKKVNYSELLKDYITVGAFNSGAGNIVDANKKGTFADDFNLKDKPAGEDAFGRDTGHYWYIDSGKREAITATYGGDGNLQHVYTTKVTGGDIYSLIDGAGKVEKENLWLYVDGKGIVDPDAAKTNEDDGEEKTLDAETLKGYFKKGDDHKIEGTGAGVETYVYSWYKDVKDKDENVTGSELHIKICVVNTYLAKIDTVTDATSKKDRFVTIDNLKQDAFNDDLTYTTDDFDEGDYVLITVANKEIQSMVPAEVIENEVTRYSQNGSNKSIVVNGKTYTPAENAVAPATGETAGDEISRSLVDGKDHKIFVLGDYVIGIAEITADSKYVYVADIGVLTDNSGKIKDSKAIKAEIYYADGKSEVVTVSIDDGYFKKYIKDSLNDEKEIEDIEGDYGLYKLTWDGSSAVLDRPDGEYDDSIANATVKQDFTKAGSYILTGKTVFFYVKDEGTSDVSVTTYTGIGSVPKGKDGENELKAVIADKDDSKVKAALVSNGEAADDGDIVYYFQGTSAEVENGKGYYAKSNGGKTVTYDVYEPGKKEVTQIEKTYSTEKAAESAISAAGDAGFYYVKGDKLVPAGEKKGNVNYKLEQTVSGATEYGVTISETEYSAKSATVVDLSGEGITSLSKLERELGNYGSITIAFSYDEDGYVKDLYITGTTPKPATTPESGSGAG